MSHVIIHLGYPKTGTTYLQRKIFSQLRSEYSIVTPEFQNIGINIRRLMYSVESNTVDDSQIRSLSNGKNGLISLEGLLLESMRTIEHGNYVRKPLLKSLYGLRELTKNFSEITIVIYVRIQDELIHSLYVESKIFHFDGCKKLNTLEKYINSVIKDNDVGFYYNFSNAIKEIREVFSTDCINIRFYEDLKCNLDAEIEFWQSLTGINLDVVGGGENIRSVREGVKVADSRNAIKYFLIESKRKYFPGFKLPNNFSKLLRRAISKFDSNAKEEIKMSFVDRKIINDHFACMNSSDEFSHFIPEHLVSLYCKGSES